MATRSKGEMISELKQMLRDLFAARDNGAVYPRTARAHGYIDGYMRALLDAGLATQRELLDIVAAERAALAGPATRTMDPSTEEAAA